MALHYVYVDSRDRNPDEPVNDFTVKLHNPLRNVVKCGMVSFAKANNSFNIHNGNRTVRWVEAYKSGENYVSRNFNITLETGYYSAEKLLNDITTLMNTTTGRQVASETVTTYTYNIDEDYRASIIGTAASTVATNRWWGFYSSDFEFKHSVVHSIFNYTRAQILRTKQIDPASTSQLSWRQSQSTLSPALRTLKAAFSYQENQSMMHIASDTLAQNSQKLTIRDNQSYTMKTNILEAIPITVNRWSYIQVNKAVNDILYHTMHNVNLDSFDLKLLNEHYIKLDDGDADFKACFVFETLDDAHEEVKEMHREFNAQAYRMAH